MRTYPWKSVLTFALALALGSAGCASGGGGSTRAPGASSTRIVQAELDELPQMNGYQAIQRLRARWLQSRSGAPVLYVDGARRNEVRDLESILITDISEMRWMNATDATNNFGTGHSGGAILVTTR